MINGKNDNSTTRPVIWLMVVIFVISVGYLIFNFYFKSSLAELAAQRSLQSNIIGGKIVEQLPINILHTDQFFNLTEHYYREYAEQAEETAAYYPTPSLPAMITVDSTKLGDSVFISWQAPKNQSYDGVEIYRSDTPKRRDHLVQAILGDDGSIVDTDVLTNSKYYYTLRTWRTVESEKFYSEFSETYEIIPSDDTAPLAPSGIAVQRNPDNPAELIVSWNPIDDNDAVELWIRRSQEAGVIGTVIEKVDPSVTQLRDDTVEPGIIYYYSVSAVDRIGNESSTRLTIAPFGNAEPFITDASKAVEVLYPDGI